MTCWAIRYGLAVLALVLSVEICLASQSRQPARAKQTVFAATAVPSIEQLRGAPIHKLLLTAQPQLVQDEQSYELNVQCIENCKQVLFVY